MSGPKRDGYHHGDLRATLLRVGLELVRERGINGFTLREVARRAGVSHAAPYHHFADRGALVRAIVTESYEALADALAAASDGDGDGDGEDDDPIARIARMGEGYVAFALADADRYRLMFRTELTGNGPGTDELDRAGARAFGVLVAGVEAAHDAGRLASDVDVGVAATACWATVHGAASLVLNGALGIRADQPDRARQLANRLVGITLRGLGA